MTDFKIYRFILLLVLPGCVETQLQTIWSWKFDLILLDLLNCNYIVYVCFSTMGRKTHGPYLIAAIEYNDIEKVSEILVKQFRDRRAIRDFLVSEIPRLTSDQTEIPLLLAASLPDPAILRYFVVTHRVNVNHVFEYGGLRRRKRTTALLTAIQYSNHDTVDAILDLNGEINIADHKGRRPLHRSIKRLVSAQ